MYDTKIGNLNNKVRVMNMFSLFSLFNEAVEFVIIHQNTS